MVLFHLSCMLLSYVAFLVAFVSGILFLIQEYQLKNKRMGQLFHHLPSLGGLDRLNFAAIGAGFALLTGGMLLGFIEAHQHMGRWWMGDSKEVLTVGLWGWYLLLWAVRLRSTLRGRRVALLSVLGFGFVLFTAVGASLLLSSVHPYTRAQDPVPAREAGG